MYSSYTAASIAREYDLADDYGINLIGAVGIKIIEAYPTIPTQEKLPDSFAWIGLYKSFERAGFEIVDTTSKNRPMVRYLCKQKTLANYSD